MASQLEQHLAWPVSPAEIRAAVGDDAADVRIRRPARKRPGDAIVRVTWVPDEDRSDLDGEPLLVVISPVQLERRGPLRATVREQVLPDLGAWIRSARSATDAWKSLRHVRRYAVDDHGLAIDEREGRGLMAGPPEGSEVTNLTDTDGAPAG